MSEGSQKSLIVYFSRKMIWWLWWVEKQKFVCISNPWAATQSYSGRSGLISVHGLRGLDINEFIEKTVSTFVLVTSTDKTPWSQHHTYCWTEMKNYRHAMFKKDSHWPQVRTPTLLPWGWPLPPAPAPPPPPPCCCWWSPTYRDSIYTRRSLIWDTFGI